MLEHYLDRLIQMRYIASKALSTISITHTGIKKVEQLLEKSSQPDVSVAFIPQIDANDKSEILEIQIKIHCPKESV